MSEITEPMIAGFTFSDLIQMAVDSVTVPEVTDEIMASFKRDHPELPPMDDDFEAAVRSFAGEAFPLSVALWRSEVLEAAMELPQWEQLAEEPDYEKIMVVSIMTALATDGTLRIEQDGESQVYSFALLPEEVTWDAWQARGGLEQYENGEGGDDA